jgi:hypothetical protein
VRKALLLQAPPLVLVLLALLLVLLAPLLAPLLAQSCCTQMRTLL